jgi:8-oxo-dGTP diphosphatase
MATDLIKPRLRVVAAALFDAAGRVLLAERPAGKHMAGWWEFPGGKVGKGESDADALVRELREELGVESRAHREIATMSHEYPDRIVELVLWHASIASGEPRGLDGQQLQWVDCQSLGRERLLPADQPLIPHLQALSSRHDWCLTQQVLNGEIDGR